MLYLFLPFFIPIGFYVLKFEKKNNKKYFDIFEQFHQDVKNNDKLTNKEKMILYEKVLHRNNCIVTFKSDYTIIGECSKISIGWLLISAGFIYLGAILYLIYYFFFKKKHKIQFKI